MKSVIIIVIAFVLLIPITAFGYGDGYFESDYGKVLSHEPIVCLFQPNDVRIDDDIWKRYVNEMRNGIYSWNSALDQLGDGDWDLEIVEVPLNKLDLLNEYLCDIPVKFTKNTHSGIPSALGWASPTYGDISLKYHKYEYCGTEYNSEYKITINKRCFSNDLERPKYVASVLQHEIGHTLGLGHYVGYDYRTTQQWYDYGIGMPSIMTHQTSNEELKEITNVDVNKIYEIYGQKGFGKKTDFTPMFNERIIPEPVIPIAGVTNIYIADSSVSKLISGYIPDKLYKRGTYLEILIQDPNGFVETKAVTVSKTLKSYKHNLNFDQNSQSGNYMIFLKFDGTIFEKIPIFVSKGSVIINHDQDGDGVSGVDDVCPNTPIGDIVTPDGCSINTPNSENGKTVINEKFYVSGYSIDYSITSGKLLHITRDVEANSLIISISATSEGSLTLAIPRSVLDTKIDGTHNDDVFFVLVDGEVVHFDETPSSYSKRTLTISFSADVEEIEIIGTESRPYRQDSDGDGFVDAEDSCPTVKGIGKLNGCPDTNFIEVEELDSDGDGFPDVMDNCPNLYYTTFGGCPKSIAPKDMDNDRILDGVDRCPRVFALTEDGCPETIDNWMQEYELQYEKRIEKEEKEKDEQKLRMNVLETELNSIKEKVSETQKIIDDTYNDIKNAESKSDSEESKKIIERSWSTYNQALDDFTKSEGWANEYDQKIKEANVGSFDEQKGYYGSLVPEMKSFNEHQFKSLDKKLVGITEELNNLEKMQKQTCFFIWCW